MTRTNVHHFDAIEGTTLAGWFDRNAADEYDEATEWDGNNHISRATGSQWDHETLYRTKGGRWVLHCSSMRQGSRRSYEFVTDEDAQTWLLANEHEDAVTKHFGPIPDESGPGRPREGTAISTRLRDDQLADLDRLAAARSISRADAIRTVIDAGLRAAK